MNIRFTDAYMRRDELTVQMANNFHMERFQQPAPSELRNDRKCKYDMIPEINSPQQGLNFLPCQRQFNYFNQFKWWSTFIDREPIAMEMPCSNV